MITPNPNLTPAPEASAPASPPKTIQRIVCTMIFGYAACTVLLFLGMESVGERWWPLAVSLYLPQRIFLLPLIVLVPAALLVEVSLGTYAMLGGVLIIFLWHVPYYPGLEGRTGADHLKVITNNYSRNHGLHIEPFIQAENPDFVALEDARGQGPLFQREFPDRSVAGVGQFVFMSKVPITSATNLAWPTWLGAPVAAVFEVPWHGQNVAFYTVHLPTPRGGFAKLAGLGLLREVAGDNRRRSDDMSFSEEMTARVQLARDMARVLATEQRPFVALGDFNMPPDGYVYRVITRRLTDCFAQNGRGFGFTFPCDTHNPITLGGPWLRIDYVLGGPGWHGMDCRVEPGRRSKHRAVVAELSLN